MFYILHLVRLLKPGLSLKPDDKFWPDQISKVTIVTNGNKPRLKEYSRCNN